MADSVPRRRKVLDLDEQERRRRRRDVLAAVGYAGMWPLNAPGMPPPGPDFLRAALNQDDGTVFTSKIKNKQKVVDYRPGAVLARLYRRALREVGFTLAVTGRGGKQQDVSFVPGHIWGQGVDDWKRSYHDPAFEGAPVDGPHPAEVMVVGKMPWKDEIIDGRNLVGASGEILRELAQRYHCRKFNRWYVTNLVKFLPPDEVTTLLAGWVHDCLPLLHQELRIVRPKYILCLGADASKWLLDDDKYTVTHMAGRVVPLTYRVNCSVDEEPEYHTAHVMTVLHPAEVSRAPEKRRILESNFTRFTQLLNGKNLALEEEGLDHRVIDTYEDAVEWAQEVNAYFANVSPPARLVAWDAEWHGQHPVNSGSYLRTIQLAWDHKRAVCFKIRHQGGKVAFRDRDGRPAFKRLARLLNDLMMDKRAVGHFFVADLEWLHHCGIFPTRHCKVPLGSHDGKQGWQRLRDGEGWFDTAMMNHAVEETAPLGLDMLAMRYTSAPPYYAVLEEEIKKYCTTHGIKREALEGYGEVPDKILLPYACLHGDSLVQLADGSWKKIRVLVNERYSGCVRAFVGGSAVDAKVTNWHRHDASQKDWYRIRTVADKAGRYGPSPIFTPDHRVLTARGKVRVDELRSGEDSILTDEREFSSDQLSVFLGSLLGDGGLTRQNRTGIGFLFSQVERCGDYADWKAGVFSTHFVRRRTVPGSHAYELPFSRYLYQLSLRFPTKEPEQRGNRKAVITSQLLDALGDLGLAVWYQDDGTLVTDKRCGATSSRIYCRIDEEERRLIVRWLSQRFGNGISYNAVSRFLQITGEAFGWFHATLAPYMHPAVAYKTPLPVVAACDVKRDGLPYYERIEAVVPWDCSGPRRGNGVRYCLTVDGAGNFLTKAGFVSNCYDADVTLRIAGHLMSLLDRDYEGNCCWEPFWESMIIQKTILRINSTGICVDRARADDLTAKFLTARVSQEEEIRHWAKWPEFNVRSVLQVKEFLFGHEYNGKRDKDGNKVRVRPPDAVSLYLEPLLDTSKPPRRWADLKARNEHLYASPGTGKTILGVLAQENLEQSQQISWVRDYRFLDQVLKSVLRPPLTDEDDRWIVNDDGFLEYEAGLVHSMDDDGRVRTHIYPTAETGRWKSSRPALHNFSKARDADYARMLGADVYTHKLRSVLMPSPGYVFVEFDYKGAELYMMALMSGSMNMREHCERANTYQEEGYDLCGVKALPGHVCVGTCRKCKKDKSLVGRHPCGGSCHACGYPDLRYYDIHSNVAKLAFLLECHASKFGLDLIGKVHFRTLAKNVVFGVAYGRGAKAIALQAKEQGVNVSVEQAQQVVDAIFAMYPELVPFFDEARRRARDPGWLCHCFGRFRRFPTVADFKLEGEFERQAMNFSIQGGIASAMNRGLTWLEWVITEQKLEDDIRILLQMHDAGLIECRPHIVPHAKELIEWAMIDKVEIWPTDLAGVPRGDGPYHLGLDFSVEARWGERIHESEYAKFGIPAH